MTTWRLVKGLLATLPLLAFSGVLSVATPVVAAPAEPFAVDDCFVRVYATTCVQTHGVITENESASGNTTYVINRESCSQVYVDGTLTSGECIKSHQVIVTSDGVAHVLSSHGRGQHTFVHEGVTYNCTSAIHVVFANGEVRHRDSHQECDPPLP